MKRIKCGRSFAGTLVRSDLDKSTTLILEEKMVRREVPVLFAQVGVKRAIGNIDSLRGRQICAIMIHPLEKAYTCHENLLLSKIEKEGNDIKSS